MFKVTFVGAVMFVAFAASAISGNLTENITSSLPVLPAKSVAYSVNVFVPLIAVMVVFAYIATPLPLFKTYHALLTGSSAL